MSKWEPVEFDRDFVLSELHQRGLMPRYERAVENLCRPSYVAAPGLSDEDRDRMFKHILRLHRDEFEATKGSLWARKLR